MLILSLFRLLNISRKSSQFTYKCSNLFSDEQLILTCIDFAFPPFSALSATVTFLFQMICHKPEIQRKIQDEIDTVVGAGRPPTLDDRIK